MALLQTLRCDQCADEIDAALRADNGWHSLQIHDLTLGRQGQFDLCADCWGNVRIPELIERKALANGNRD